MSQEKLIQVNGVWLHYTQNGTGPHPILCIPGTLAPCQWAFDSQLEYFGREGSGYTIVTYDPRGSGYSRPPEREFDVSEENSKSVFKTDASDAHSLMKALGFSCFSVLGWCDGGMSAICLAAQYPAAVQSLVVWGTRTYLNEQDLKAVEGLEDLQNWAPRFRKAFVQVYGSLTNLHKIWSKFMDSQRQICAIKTEGDVCSKELIKAVKCPTLVVHGAKDTLCTNAHAERITNLIQGSELHVLPEGKHDPHMSLSKIFNAVVEEFLMECAISGGKD